MVEARDVVEGAVDAVLELAGPGAAGLAVGREVAVAAGVEAGLEQRDEGAGDVDVLLERVLDVVLREGRAALPHVLRVGPQHGRLPPGQPDGEHQRVEAVDLVVALPDRGDGVLEELARTRTAAGGGSAARSRRCSDSPLEAVEAVGPLVDDLDAHRGQRRQHLGQRHRRADAEDLQPRLGRARPRAAGRRTGRGRRRRGCPRAGRGRPPRSAAGSPPCRPRGTSRRTCGPAGRRPPRRTPRARRPRSRRARSGPPRRAGARGRPGRSRRSVSPGSGRITKCSRASIDSLTRAVYSSDVAAELRS